MTLEFNKTYKILEAREVTRVTPQSPNVVKTSSGQRGKERLVELIMRCAGSSGDGAVMTVVNFSMRKVTLCHPRFSK